MGGDDPWFFKENSVRPEARDGAFPPPPIGNGMKVSCVSITLKETILAALLLPVDFLTLVNLHKGILKGIPLKPLICGKTRQIGRLIKERDPT